MHPVLLAASLAVLGQAEPIALGSRRELFVDDYLIERREGVELAFHPPVCAGPVLVREKPWEGPWAFIYATVIHDDGKYRLWYRGVPSEGPDGNAAETTCYAESDDGIAWTRPELGFHEVLGTRANNALLADCPPATHNFAPFLDANPAAPASERYKAVGLAEGGGLAGFTSADGIHWSRIGEGALLTDPTCEWVFDSLNVAFWSKSEGCYVLYYRRCPEGRRAIARMTSPDFRTWSAPVQMRYSDTGTTLPRNHLYTSGTEPYFRAPHIYVALPARFLEGEGVLDDPIFPQPRPTLEADWLARDCSDAWFLTSRGGDLYEARFAEATVRPGLDRADWASRSNYPARGIVRTGPSEMSIYVQQHNGQPDARLVRYVWRLDGFASAHAGWPGGELLTRPITFTGSRLSLNCSTTAAGSIRVALQTPEGEPYPGFSLAECRPIKGDAIDATVRWSGGSDVSALAGQPVRLRLALEEADVFSWVFEGE